VAFNKLNLEISDGKSNNDLPILSAHCFAFLGIRCHRICNWFTYSLTLFVRTIIFYRTPAGRCPVKEFLDSLSDRHARKVTWVLRLVEKLEIVPQQYFKKLVNTEDLWEVRV
jgi:hypothetical protein